MRYNKMQNVNTILNNKALKWCLGPVFRKGLYALIFLYLPVPAAL